MPAVTISAGYGAGGSAVARQVADRLGYQLLDRAISSQVAGLLKVSDEEAETGTRKRTFTERFFGALAPMAGGVVGTDDDSVIATALISGNNQVFRLAAERIMTDALPKGAVILGRAGAAALHGTPEVLTVRLFGRPDARAAHGAATESIDLETATARLGEVDKARAQYVHHLYNCDIDDPALFDLQIDSTLIPAETCVDIIVSAFHAFLGTTAAPPAP